MNRTYIVLEEIVNGYLVKHLGHDPEFYETLDDALRIFTFKAKKAEGARASDTQKEQLNVLS